MLETPKAWQWTWLSQARVTLECPADAYGLKKHAKYDEGFKGTPYLFCAAVLEGTALKPCPFFANSFVLLLANRTPSSVFTLVGLGPGFLVTFRPLWLRLSFTEHPRVVTQFTVM